MWYKDECEARVTLGQKWAQALAERARGTELAKKNDAEARAQVIIAAIPGIISNAMAKGETTECVMNTTVLNRNEYQEASFIDPLDITTLTGTARIVAQYCLDQGLQPRIVGEGMSGRKDVEMWVSIKR